MATMGNSPGLSHRAPQTACLVLILIMAIFISDCHPRTSFPLAEKGLLNLSAWDFDRTGPVRLDGTWEFYWETFITPESMDSNIPQTPPGFIPVPGLWKKNQINGKPLSPEGYATYRLRIIGLDPSRLHALYISDILSVADVWINGSLALSGGRVARNKETEHPEKHSLVARFQSPGKMTEIMLHVSNFSNVQGGINTPIWIGLDDQVQSRVNRTWIITAFLGGVILLLGFYHLILYTIRKKEVSNLYFGLYCTIWAPQILFGVNGGCLMAELFPSLPWRLSIDATLYPFGFMPALMVMFYHVLFPNRLAKMVNRIFQMSGLFFIIYLALTPPNAFDTVLFAFLPVSAGAFIYLFAMFIHDLIKKRSNTRLPAFGSDCRQ